MSREEAISHIKVMIESLENGIKALESNEEWEGIIPNVQEPSYNSIKTELKPSTDCISRQKVLDAIDAYKYLDGNDAIYRLKQWLNEQESVQPKMGHWEWNQYDSNPNIGNWHCSECRTIIPHIPEETDNTPIYKWCPMCGAKMSEIPTEAEGSDTETWNGYHGQVTAPKGTFERIFNDADNDNDI